MSSRKAPTGSGAKIRKNIDIDAAKLKAARRILGAPSDTATVDQALDDVIFVHELSVGMQKLAAAGGLVDYDVEPRIRKESKRVAERHR